MKCLAIPLLGLWLAVCMASKSCMTSVETIIQPGESIDGEAALVARLGLSDDFGLRIEQTRRTVTGLWRNRLGVYYKNVHVRACSIQASANNDGVYTGAVSGYIPDATKFDSLTFDDVLTLDELKAITADYINTQSNGPINADDLENFQHKREVMINNEGNAVLVYNIKCKFYKPGNNPNGNPRLLIGADGNVIAGYIKVRYASAHESSVAKRAFYSKDILNDKCPRVSGGNPNEPMEYGPDCTKGEKCLNARRRGSICSYENNIVRVYTLRNGYDFNQGEIVSFPCDEGPNDAVNGGNSPSSDAFYYAQVYETMMKDIGNVRQTSAEGRPHLLYVNYGEGFNNAFYNGYESAFGDGDGNLTHPFTTIEAVGHELGHAYSDYLGNFNFDIQSIVIDEVFCDICGKTLGIYAGNGLTWSFGASINKDSCQAMRWFDDPTKTGYYVDNINDVTVSEPFKAMGVLERFYYSVIAELGYPYDIAFELFIHANTLYWQADTDHEEAACGLLLSASDIGLRTDWIQQSLIERGFDAASCNLIGTKDVLTSWDSQREKNVQVSKYKNPEFQLDIPADKSGVRVAVSRNRNTNVLLKSGNNVGINEVFIAGTGVQTVTLSAADEERSNLITVTAVFE